MEKIACQSTIEDMTFEQAKENYEKAEQHRDIKQKELEIANINLEHAYKMMTALCKEHKMTGFIVKTCELCGYVK